MLVDIDKQLQLNLPSQDDVVAVRQATRLMAVEIGLNLVDQTKIVTAASELGGTRSCMAAEAYWPGSK